MIINGSINLSKIDKTKITVSKSGDKWYNLTINVNDTKDQYDHDVSITDSQTKEQRESKTPRVFIGNGKIAWQGQAKAAKPETPATETYHEDDLPF